ncbi:serine hydrolase domain-containing protein [Streptomyces sp. NRRL F-5123]|uniref:serine hydrolase domain-containing protein n=1 Tax=Streptomyces sp. NRRL F-5123 TaxID=1463856 RepID=UPI0004E1E11F|nr:serine hydrolase [Streptomyces sp. NRRL F-5123]
MSTHAGRPLPTSTPAAEGVDARGVHAFLDALEAAPGIDPHGVMLLRNGRLVAEGWWAPRTPDRPQLLYSLSKSFTSAAAGLAAADGLLDLDAPVVSYFPRFEAEITDPRSRSMLVRHIASMASGHESDTWERVLVADRAEPVRGFLSLPPDREPGTVFAYNQSCTYTLGAIVQHVTGQSLTGYLRERLFDPLGIAETVWEQFPAGRDLGFSGMYATTDAVARLGQLLLQGGVWEGRQLLPAGWVAEATRAHVPNGDGTAEGAANSDWQQGYGLQFWMSRHGFRGDGAYGQYCVVLPEHDAVLALTSQTLDLQEVLDAAWRHLLPAFGDATLTDREKDDESLRLRLSRLALPGVAGEAAPPAGAGEWAGARFAPAGGTCDEQPTLTQVSLRRDDATGWSLALTEGERTFALGFAPGGWTTTEGGPGMPPCAVSAGWTDRDTFTATVCFLETPHSLDLRCELSDLPEPFTGTFTAAWRTRPLHPRPLLHRMHGPRH